MVSVSFKQARTHISALARRAEAGERIVVTRYGKPVFEMVPHEAKAPASDREAVGET